ncbi:MAG: hypothetical protein ACE3JK_02695 [Sporolactobacillus sp.]
MKLSAQLQKLKGELQNDGRELQNLGRFYPLVQIEELNFAARRD